MHQLLKIESVTKFEFEFGSPLRQQKTMKSFPSNHKEIDLGFRHALGDMILATQPCEQEL